VELTAKFGAAQRDLDAILARTYPKAVKTAEVERARKARQFSEVVDLFDTLWQEGSSSRQRLSPFFPNAVIPEAISFPPIEPTNRSGLGARRWLQPQNADGVPRHRHPHPLEPRITMRQALRGG